MTELLASYSILWYLIIVEAMLATVQEEFHITDEQTECFYNKFMSKLPESMQRLLQAN